MKPKKLPRPRSRLSFAVDREEIDISSDWVEAVMESPVPAAPADPFFAPEDKTATVEHTSTAEVTATVAVSTTVELDATVALSATVAGLRAGRVFRPRFIRHIADGLTAGQLTVYHVMFAQAVEETGLRVYRGGYNDLCMHTGLSKRGIQNAVAELLAKAVVSIHHRPGYHRSQVSVYRVLTEEEALSVWRSRELHYAVGKSKTLVNSATVA